MSLKFLLKKINNVKGCLELRQKRIFFIMHKILTMVANAYAYFLLNWCLELCINTCKYSDHQEKKE